MNEKLSPVEPADTANRPDEVPAAGEPLAAETGIVAVSAQGKSNIAEPGTEPGAGPQTMAKPTAGEQRHALSKMRHSALGSQPFSQARSNEPTPVSALMPVSLR